MIDILVICYASFTAINRAVYYELAKHNWVLELVVPSKILFSQGKKLADPPNNKNIKLNYLALSGHNPRLFTFHRLTEILNRRKPQYVYLDNDPISRLAIQTGKWCKQNNAKLICQSNENFPIRLLENVKTRGFRCFFPALFKILLCKLSKPNVNHVFTINEEGLEIFKALGFPSVSKIPLGFDSEVFYPDNKMRIKIREKINYRGTIIAYFGRMEKEKGIHILLEVLSEMLHLNWKFMIDRFSHYFSSYHTTVFKMINQLGLSERVVTIDADHEEISSYMNAADIVVIPSYSSAYWKEQYGRVATEAMACGKAVVASNCGELPNLIGNGGFIFEEKNKKELKDCLIQLLQNPKKIRAMGSVAVKRAKLFSITAQANRINSLLLSYHGKQIKERSS